MAFVPSTVAQRSTFVSLPLPNVATCKRSSSLRMSLSDKFFSGAKVLLVSGALALGTLASLPSDANAALFHFRGERPTNIGLRYGRYLEFCPITPNCISSMANAYDSHFVPPWTYNALPGETKTTQQAIEDVTNVLKQYPGATIIESKPTKSEVGEGYYIYAEFESKLMGFVDDVEFFFQPDKTTLEYRSASRLGERDFDANRKRIRAIRVALQDTDKRWASVGF